MSPFVQISEEADQADRLAAFGHILGEAVRVWRWQGGPAKAPPLPKGTKAKARSGSKQKAESPIVSKAHDLPSRIVDILENHGEQAPGVLELKVGLSHATVFWALTGLVADGVVEVTGRTRGRRYRLREGWQAVLVAAPSGKKSKAAPDELSPRIPVFEGSKTEKNVSA